MNCEKVAVYTGTRNLYEHMIPAAKSMIANSDIEKVYLLIEDDKFPFEIPDIIETKNISGQKFFDMTSNPNANSFFTYMAMIRVAFTKIFPDLDMILSLDVDTIVINDISDIWDLPIDGYCIGACQEPDRTTQYAMYTNAGVCMQNLEMLRNLWMDDLMIEKLNTGKYKFLDQDVQNLCLQNYIYDLPSKYNVNIYCKPTDDPRIIHYAGERNWFNKPDYLKYFHMSWHDAMKLHEEKCSLNLKFLKKIR